MVNEGFINVAKKRINGVRGTSNVHQNNRRDDNVIKDVRSIANKFLVLQKIEEESLSLKLSKQEKEEGKHYSKDKNTEGIDTDHETDIELDENDVYVDKSGTATFMNKNEKEVKNLIRIERLSIRAVLETHIKKDRIEKVCMNIFGSWSWQNNVGFSRKGCRITMGWDASNVKCSLINAIEQSMLYQVDVLSSQNTFYCTFIYAANKGRDKRELWKELNLNKRIVGSSAWVIMRDVNVSLNLEDHSEGMSNITQDMIDFQECVNDIEMEDINCSGLHFTWTKSLLNPNASILKKIDRIMGNNPFLSKFSTANAVFLPYGISNHSPAMLKFPQAMTRKSKSFRLANYVTDKVEFKNMVKDKWNLDVHGYAMYRLVKKLKALKPHLNKLNWKNGNLFEKVADPKTKLFNVQRRIDLDPTNKVLRNEGVEMLREYKEAFVDEEKLLRQKAKVTWLREGDKNSAYFHEVLKGRINRNKIMFVCVEDGRRCENCDVADQFVKHFEGFLGINPPVTRLTVNDAYLFVKQILGAEAIFMKREINDEEIKIALFYIDDDKALGPDGYTSKFYKKAWDVIKGEFCAAIKEFFLTGKLLGEVNATLISLILTNRIKSILNQIMDDNQSAFVPGRAITDNILLTQELLKGYNCINGPKRCSFKIDIQKDYDTVNWLFIEEVLRQFGFPEKMIGWIMTCISTPKFTICVNGERFRYFRGGRGLRQGDPISPYIFTMVMEMLNLVVKDEIRKEKAVSVQTLKKALYKFSAISGLHPNLGKCTMLCGSLDDEKKNAISCIFPFKKGKLLVRYLRVIFVTKRLVSMIESSWWTRIYASILGNVAVKKESLWVKWINVVKLKQRSVWDVDVDPKDSRGWKCLLNLRSWIGEHMRYRIRDGKSISVWHDKWNNGTSLSSFISKKDVFYAGLNNMDKLSDMIYDNGWRWPQNWIIKHPWLSNIKVHVLSNTPDKPVLLDNNGKDRRFFTNIVWKDVRGNNDKKQKDQGFIIALHLQSEVEFERLNKVVHRKVEHLKMDKVEEGTIRVDRPVEKALAQSLVLVPEDENEGDGFLDEDETLLDHGLMDLQAPLISLNALTRTTNFKTIRVFGIVGKHIIHILIDCGSTHNFLDKNMAKKIGYHMRNTCPLAVTVADGNNLVTTSQCSSYDHRIPLVEGAQLVNIRPYRHPPTQKDAIKGMVVELLEARVIKKSNSPFSSPIVMVKKKDNSRRMLEDHALHLKSMLEIMRHHKLYAKRSKCVFGTDKVEYMGHVISTIGVSTNPGKITAMTQWPVPTNLKQLRGFLGLTGYYRRFIQGYASISKPLTQLLKKNSFVWTEESQAAFL
ncbi:RNA-directed DNA polymerase, eukaryota, reverse transcriptase zinc-binding domain protein [Tanacetum coccineum]